MNEGEIGGPVALPVDPTGVRGLDVVLGGGLPRRALSLVSGPPGSGKTTLTAQLAVAAAQAGRRALIVTAFAESSDKLIAHLRTYRFFDADLLGDSLEILSLGQFLDAGMARLAEEVIGLVRDRRARLVALDGFDGVRGIDPDPQAARRLLYVVGNAAAALDATTLVTSVADPRDITFAPQATVADVIVRLGYDLVGMRERRRLEVVKIRGAGALVRRCWGCSSL
ncbi:MAG: AAA family ATPase [Chloroflexi bacterium]|nr:AAA family ATPase [Chloroflexota bacterium]